MNTKKPCTCVFVPTSQTSAAVVVFPTPGGPESRAALYPDPSSLPPPNLPYLAAVQQKHQTRLSLRQRVFFKSLNSARYIQLSFCYLPAGCPPRQHHDVCSSSAASGAACWHSSVPPAGQSQPSETEGDTCPPKGGSPPSLMEMRMRRKAGPAPSEPCGPSPSRMACCHRRPWNWDPAPDRSWKDSGCGETWSYPWRGRSSELWGCSLRCGWGRSWP